MDRIPALEHLRLLLAVGEEAEAARFVRELRAVDIDAEGLLAPVAATLLEREHCQLALELALDALDADLHCAPAHQVRIDALAEMGDIDGARLAAEEWTTVDPGSPDAFVALSWARLAGYDDDGAAEAAAHARDLDPDAASGWLALAYVCRLSQQWDPLRLYCMQALDRDPANVDAQLFLGEALLATGRHTQAMVVLGGIDDPRARSARRHHQLQRAALAVAFVVVCVVLFVGLARGSTGVAVGAAVGVGACGRRLLPHPSLHPALVWGVVALVAAAVVRSLV